VNVNQANGLDVSALPELQPFSDAPTDEAKAEVAFTPAAEEAVNRLILVRAQKVAQRLTDGFRRLLSNVMSCHGLHVCMCAHLSAPAQKQTLMTNEFM
jgi:hypothetical protein